MSDKQKELDIIDGLIKTMRAAHIRMIPFTTACTIQLTIADVDIIRRALEDLREKVADA